RFNILNIRSRSSACSSFLSLGAFSLFTDLQSFAISETRATNQFDKGDDGCKHDYQRDCTQVKLENKNQHPDEHEKHENCPKHQRTSWMPVCNCRDWQLTSRKGL